MKNAFAAICAVRLIWMSAAGLAHHGDAGRYEEKPFIITGTLAEIVLTNPHSTSCSTQRTKATARS